MDALMLPRVSIVVVNYNYGSYLEAAVQSALEQTYPNVEILIVDDFSTDDSSGVIDRICQRNAAVIPVKLSKNGGQSVASGEGLAKSTGSYVLFLDADDRLLPRCVETHIYAHLSSRIPVAFTSVDIISNVAGQDINMSHAGFSDYVRSQRGLLANAVRPLDECLSESWFGQRPPALNANQMHYVLPPYLDPWVWSPASATCYRRDAVTLLLEPPGLERVRWGTDAFLMKPLSALFGSILIDRPLVRYTIHTNNRFAKSAPLNKLSFFDARATADDTRDMARAGLERLLASADRYGPRYTEPGIFFQAMRALGECWPGPKLGEQPGEYYTQQLLANERVLKRNFDAEVVDDAINRRGWRHRARRLLRKGAL